MINVDCATGAQQMFVVRCNCCGWTVTKEGLRTACAVADDDAQGGEDCFWVTVDPLLAG